MLRLPVYLKSCCIVCAQCQRTSSAIAASKLRSELSALRSTTTDAKAYIFRLEKQQEYSQAVTTTMLNRSSSIVSATAPPATPDRPAQPPASPRKSPLGPEFDHKLRNAHGLLESMEGKTATQERQDSDAS